MTTSSLVANMSCVILHTRRWTYDRKNIITFAPQLMLLTDYLKTKSERITSMFSRHPSDRSPPQGDEYINAWILNNDTEPQVQLLTAYTHAGATACPPSFQAELSSESTEQYSFARLLSSCSSLSSVDRHEYVPQLQGLFQIPEKHLIPDKTRYSTPPVSDYVSYASSQMSMDSNEGYCKDAQQCAMTVHLTSKPAHTCHISRYTFNDRAISTCSDKTSALPCSRRSSSPKPDQTMNESTTPPLDFIQQLTPSVLAIRHTWASLEAYHGVDNQQVELHLIIYLSALISSDGHSLFEYHISHLLPGANNTLLIQKLWYSLSAGQKTYWRKLSSKFQLPFAFEYWQLALRNLETEHHNKRHSSIVRKAKMILENASVDTEGPLVATPNLRNPTPERELQLWKLEAFAATRKICRCLNELQVSFGPRKNALCRNLARFIAGTGWTMFVFHGIPRVEEVGEAEAMAKLRAIWSGMTADDRLYWIEVTGRVIQGLRGGSSKVLAFFSLDAWSIKEARECAEAWVQFL